MALRDLDDFLVTKPIELPIRGKTYRFPGTISAEAGLVVRRLQEVAEDARRAQAEGREVDADAVALDDVAEVDLRREMLGDAEREMAADGLTDAHVQHVFQTLMVWHMAGREAGEAAWEGLAGGGPPVPNRAERRKGSSGSATSTRSPASTSGTRARQSSSLGRVEDRPGGTSSPAGT